MCISGLVTLVTQQWHFIVLIMTSHIFSCDVTMATNSLHFKLSTNKIIFKDPIGTDKNNINEALVREKLDRISYLL